MGRAIGIDITERRMIEQVSASLADNRDRTRGAMKTPRASIAVYLGVAVLRGSGSGAIIETGCNQDVSSRDHGCMLADPFRKRSAVR